jgi:hypothetical protein
MNATPSRIAAALAAFLLTGCAAGLKPLQMTEANRSLSSVASLPHKQTAPINIRILSIDAAPTTDGMYTYPLKQYYMKAFKDAMAAAFPEGEEACSYSLDVTASKSELETSGKTGRFAAEITSIIRGPDNRTRGDAVTYKGEVTSKFDRKQTPESVWAVSYAAAKDLLKKMREEHWFKVELLQPACHAENTVAQAALQPAESAPAAAAQPKTRLRVSDVDTPNYTADKEYPDNYALVIGIEKYQNIPDATYAEHDAAAVKEHLLALGYPEQNIIMLVGAQAGKSSIQKYVESWLPKNLTPNSRLFVYYSGHGAPVPETGDTYLLPWDADPAFLESTGYSKKKLYAELNKLPAKQIIVAMDSCFSGTDGVLGKIRPLVNVNDEKVDGKIVVFSAASSKEITGAKDDQTHGLFTYFFLKGLNGEARDKSTREVTLSSLSKYVQNEVSEAAHRDGNRNQHPQYEAASDTPNSLVLRAAP